MNATLCGTIAGYQQQTSSHSNLATRAGMLPLHVSPAQTVQAASDEDLLEKVNLAANNEAERLDKHKRTPAQVNTVQETSEAKIDMNSIHKEIKALIRAEIVAI